MPSVLAAGRVTVSRIIFGWGHSCFKCNATGGFRNRAITLRGHHGLGVKSLSRMMKPSLSLLDDSFRYVPAAATSVSMTWRRFGWRPPSDFERWPRLTARPTYAARRIDGAAMREVEVISIDAEGNLISGPMED